MPGTTTLAAAVFVAFSPSALLAQGQTSPNKPYVPYYPDGAPGQPPASVPAKVDIPQELHFCAAHCLTFTLEKDGTLVNRTNLPNQHDEKRVLAIESFTSQSVVIHRTDTGSNPGDGMMRGRMQYGNSSAVGDGWMISWGKELNTLPGSDEERAQRAGVPAAAPKPSPLALLFGLLLSSGDSGDGDITQRITRLADQLDSARTACNTQMNQSRGRERSACDRQDDIQSQVYQAHGHLLAEIEDLTEAHNKVTTDCNAGDKSACEKLKQVDAQLSKDRQFQFSNMFR